MRKNAGAPLVNKQTPKSNRQRFLNIIYFIDSNKTKTFKFSLNASYGIVGALIFTVLWSLVSTVLLFDSYSHSNSQSERVRSLLSTIFNYQTRYDQVYEKTYTKDSIPQRLAKYENKEKEEAKKKAEMVANKPVAAKVEKIALAAKATPIIEAVKPDEVKAKPKVAQNGLIATVPKPESTDPIKMNRFKLSKQGNKLKLNLAIKNLVRPEKANGFVVGYARFIGLDGKTTIVSSPPGFKEGQKIKRLDLPRSHRFSIRYYTKKSLLFDLPDKKGGTFESIKIIVKVKGSDDVDFMYNIKGSKGAFAPVAKSKPKIKRDRTKRKKSKPKPAPSPPANAAPKEVQATTAPAEESSTNEAPKKDTRKGPPSPP